jgi:hypothetical protein
MARPFSLVALVCTLTSIAVSASAQTPPPPPPGPPPPPPMETMVVAAPVERVNSVNGNPLGALVGDYSINYERLLGGSHGLMIEGRAGFDSNSTSKSTLFGGGVGYRWHWLGRQNSGFLGMMAGYSTGTGTTTVTTNGNQQTFDLTIKAPWVVGNIGKRWAWDNGLNITFRIGAGWAGYKVSTTSTDPNAQEGVKLLQDLLTLIPIALDGELSLGYNF